MKYLLSVLILLVVCGTLNAREAIQVTPKVVKVQDVTFSKSERKGFGLVVEWTTKDGRKPNTVQFIPYTACAGLEFLDGEDCRDCSNRAWVTYERNRPKNSTILYFAVYELKLSDEDKKYIHPRPPQWHEIKSELHEYINIHVQQAYVWSNVEIREAEFSDAMSQHEWDNDINYMCGITNMTRSPGYDPKKPIEVLFWHDLPLEDIVKLEAIVNKIAKKCVVQATIKRGGRRLDGTYIEDGVENITLPVDSNDMP
jgi:hypothetical protein